MVKYEEKRASWQTFPRTNGFDGIAEYFLTVS